MGTMLTRILIARHGNTFLPGQTPTRVGSKTDLPLVEEQRSRNIGKFIKEKKLIPQLIFASPLKRTMQTAELIVTEIAQPINILPAIQFAEIDYGPDENKPEAEVELRLGKTQFAKNGVDSAAYSTEQIQTEGKKIIEAWNTQALVPEGWIVNTEKSRQTWLEFATMVETVYQNQTVMVVSSNGIMRFAPHLTEDFSAFAKNFNIKVATGNLCIFEKSAKDKYWNCTGWDIKPSTLTLRGEKNDASN